MNIRHILRLLFAKVVERGTYVPPGFKHWDDTADGSSFRGNFDGIFVTVCPYRDTPAVKPDWNWTCFSEPLARIIKQGWAKTRDAACHDAVQWCRQRGASEIKSDDRLKEDRLKEDQEHRLKEDRLQEERLKEGQEHRLKEDRLQEERLKEDQDRLKEDRLEEWRRLWGLDGQDERGNR